MALCAPSPFPLPFSSVRRSSASAKRMTALLVGAPADRGADPARRAHSATCWKPVKRVPADFWRDLCTGMSPNLPCCCLNHTKTLSDASCKGHRARRRKENSASAQNAARTTTLRIVTNGNCRVVAQVTTRSSCTTPPWALSPPGPRGGGGARHRGWKRHLPVLRSKGGEPQPAWEPRRAARRSRVRGITCATFPAVLALPAPGAAERHWQP